MVLATGQFTWSLPLSSAGAIGVGSWGLGLDFLAGNNVNEVAGPSFNFTQNTRLILFDDNDVDLLVSNNTRYRFTYDEGSGTYSSADNNSGSTLTRENIGTADEQFRLVTPGGNVSIYYSYNSEINTPGRIKSLTDRNGNTITFTWTATTNQILVTSVTDSYGRTTQYHYYGSEQGFRLREVEDFLGRKLNFQFDSDGRLVAVITPSILRAAEGNTFEGGTAYVFQYDSTNKRPERQNDLMKIWYPNQATRFIDPDTRTINVQQVYDAGPAAPPRYVIQYGQDPTDEDTWGRVLRQTVGDPANDVGGTYEFMYTTNPDDLPTNIVDPADPVVSRTVLTDRNGNQTIYDFNAEELPVRVEVIASRMKNSLQADSYITWTQYNDHNQPVLVIFPEGNSVEYGYEDGQVTGIGYYGPRDGLLLVETRKVDNPYKSSNPNFPSDPTNPDYLIPANLDGASNGQTELTRRYFYDPIYNQQTATIEERGNPIDDIGTYFTPQNGGTTPTNADRSRYTTITYFDYQKDSEATVTGDSDLQNLLGLNAAEIQALIDHVDDQMKATDGTGGIPDGFEMNLGDINGDGTGNGSGLPDATHLGNVVKIKHPSVRLIGSTSITTQDREEIFTVNVKGQTTTHTGPEGNLTVTVRYPENDPEGDGKLIIAGLSNKQYGRARAVHVDADPNDVMSLIGEDGDLVDFIPGVITRNNTPSVYQNLVTRYEGDTLGGGSCTSCAYDQLGFPLAETDPRGFTTHFDRNELGEKFRTTSTSPYEYQVERHFDANRNVIRTDIEDKIVDFTSDDPSSAEFAKFIASGNDLAANFPAEAGPGGSVRPGWFTNLTTYDLLDNVIETDIDATGSDPDSLVTINEYDANENLIKTTKPEGNTIEYDYDERNLQIATRAGDSPDEPAVNVQVYNKNGNLIQAIGPAARGGPGNQQTVMIEDAFQSGETLTHTGDWLVENTYDGFDRVTSTKDSVGNVVDMLYDPGSRSVQSTGNGPIGGATPTNRDGTDNVILVRSHMRFDEAGREYESQQDVFIALDTQMSTAITHTGGGLATNSTANDHTGTFTLTDGSDKGLGPLTDSYVLTRTIYDRANRVVEVVADNTGSASTEYDGANRRLNERDPLGNQADYGYDANSNAVLIKRTEQCSIDTHAIPNETFESAMKYDSLNRPVVAAEFNPAGTAP